MARTLGGHSTYQHIKHITIYLIIHAYGIKGEKVKCDQSSDKTRPLRGILLETLDPRFRIKVKKKGERN